MMKRLEENQSRQLTDIAYELKTMERALLGYHESLRQFYFSSRAGDWLQAEQHRLAALSHMESSMDAYTRSCRIQFET
jgi:signal transduction histidine kinase